MDGVHLFKHKTAMQFLQTRFSDMLRSHTLFVQLPYHCASRNDMIFLVSRHWQLVWQFQGWCSNIIGSSFGNRCFGGVEVAVPACLHLQYALFFWQQKSCMIPARPVAKFIQSRLLQVVLPAGITIFVSGFSCKKLYEQYV
jgi:hypothetical protein